MLRKMTLVRRHVDLNPPYVAPKMHACTVHNKIEKRIAPKKNEIFRESVYSHVLRAQWKSFKFTFKVAWTMASQDAQFVVAQVDDSQVSQISSSCVP
jgi:hypothetical protein